MSKTPRRGHKSVTGMLSGGSRASKLEGTMNGHRGGDWRGRRIGVGKDHRRRRIVESIGDDQVTVLEHDRYYRDRNDLRLEERAALNYDHPDSLETDLMVRHVHELRAGPAGRAARLRFRAARAPPRPPTPSRRAGSSSSKAS